MADCTLMPTGASVPRPSVHYSVIGICVFSRDTVLCAYVIVLVQSVHSVQCAPDVVHLAKGAVAGKINQSLSYRLFLFFCMNNAGFQLYLSYRLFFLRTGIMSVFCCAIPSLIENFSSL